MDPQLTVGAIAAGLALLLIARDVGAFRNLRGRIALLFPVRLQVSAWRDRRTADMRHAYSRVLREIRKQRKTCNRPDLHVGVERDAVPAWLEQLPQNVTILRKQAS